jgi:hypothetical protein
MLCCYSIYTKEALRNTTASNYKSSIHQLRQPYMWHMTLKHEIILDVKISFCIEMFITAQQIDSIEANHSSSPFILSMQLIQGFMLLVLAGKQRVVWALVHRAYDRY